MNTIKAPENIMQLVFEGDSRNIYQQIIRSSQQCIDEAKAALLANEIDSDEMEQLKSLLEEELDEAKEFRFSLSTIDNRIKKDKQRNPQLKRYISEKTKNGQPDSNFLLLELFVDPPPETVDESVIHAALPLRDDFNQALRLRIKLTWCWDEILQEHRELLLIRVQKLGSQLLMYTLQLQDQESEQLVKEILLSLELRPETQQVEFNLPEDPSSLQELLHKGVEELNKIYDSITRLDHQRNTIKKTQTQLQNQIEKPYIGYSQSPKKSHEGGTTQQKNIRMIFGEDE